MTEQPGPVEMGDLSPENRDMLERYRQGFPSFTRYVGGVMARYTDAEGKTGYLPEVTLAWVGLVNGRCHVFSQRGVVYCTISHVQPWDALAEAIAAEIRRMAIIPEAEMSIYEIRTAVRFRQGVPLMKLDGAAAHGPPRGA